MNYHLISVGITLFAVFFSTQSFGQTTMMNSNPLEKSEVLLYNTKNVDDANQEKTTHNIHIVHNSYFGNMAIGCMAGISNAWC